MKRPFLKSQGPLGQNGGTCFKFTDTGDYNSNAGFLVAQHKGGKWQALKVYYKLVRENENSSTAEKMKIVQLLIKEQKFNCWCPCRRSTHLAVHC